MRIVPDHLKRVAGSILRSLEASAEEADLIAESLVKAEMRGIPTHGVNFLPMLAERIEQGLVAVPTQVAVVHADDALLQVPVYPDFLVPSWFHSKTRMNSMT